ncbi:uncharacterized protein LOC102806198 [Saccoglossus kowalevskii]|uniref:Uncharacterized protein LOC102806198 n=1 Tax=Saccoglossus kowalevskii TaxID=10224 RepID=A0ABM0MZV7_SACKO|nr:PREDICTED: uncharacterized protein LOC102806198 [Saccoglossus kowalevskii]
MAAADESPLHELFRELNAELTSHSDIRKVRNLLHRGPRTEDDPVFKSAEEVFLNIEKQGRVSMRSVDLVLDLFRCMKREELKDKVLAFAEKYNIPVREKHKRKRVESPDEDTSDDENDAPKRVYVGEPVHLRLVCESEIWSPEKKRQFIELEHKKIEMLMKAAERIYLIDLDEITKIEKGGHTKLQLMGEAFESFRETLEGINVEDSPMTRRWYLCGENDSKVPLESSDVERLLTKLRVNDTITTSTSDDGMALRISAMVNSSYLEPLERSSKGLFRLPWNQTKEPDE